MNLFRRLISGLLAVLLLGACTGAFAETVEPLIAAGGSFMYARDSQGNWYCWGDNQFGQLGRGNKTNNKEKVYEFRTKNPDLDPADIKGVYCGCDYTYFLMNDGRIFGAGTSNNGQHLDVLGNKATHVLLSYRDPTIVTMATGYGQTLALNEAGEVYAWGRNNKGQVGNGTRKQVRKQPYKLDLPKITMIACGGLHSAALDENGDLWMWGDNSYHQISPAKDKMYTSPVKVDLGGLKVAMMDLGGHCSAIVDENGDMYMWGRNDTMQLSFDTGKTKFVAEKTKVDLPLPVKTFSSYGSQTWAVLEDGSLWTWGHDDYGQLGIGQRTPANVGLPLSKVYDSGVVKVTVGDLFGQAMLEDGTLLSAGMNKFGQLGRTAPYNGDASLGVGKIDLIAEK